MGPEALQKKLMDEARAYEKLEKDIAKTNGLRLQLDGQLNENNSVKEEFDCLEASATVYKLIGPVLIRQDLEEAKQNVNKRIEYITNELKRHEQTLEKYATEKEAKKEVLNSLNQQLQQMQVKAAAMQK